MKLAISKSFLQNRQRSPGRNGFVKGLLRNLLLLFIGLKRRFDQRLIYAQFVITDNCNLSCSYCNEFTPGGPIIPLAELKRRVDKLDSLGTIVYDMLGGEPLLHPDLPELITYIKTKRRGNVWAIMSTNGFRLTESLIDALNAAGLDILQISVDSVYPTASSCKALKSIMPKLHLLSQHAKFYVKIQTVLTESTVGHYEEFRLQLCEMPFDWGFAFLHDSQGQIAIRGEKFRKVFRNHNLFRGMQLFRQHAEEMLMGDYSRPWMCLAGSKFLYINSLGQAQYCSQNREFKKDLDGVSLRDLVGNRHHKDCEPGCAIGCVRSVSQAINEPLGSLKSILSIVRSTS